MKSSLAVIIVLLVAGNIRSQEYYVRLDALEYSNDTLTRDRASHSSMISHKSPASSVFYWTESGSSGTFSGSLWRSGAPDAAKEVYCHFSISGAQSQLRLVGTVISVDVSDGGKIESGQRRAIDTPITINQVLEWYVGSLQNGRRAVLRAGLSDTRPILAYECAPNQLKLVTVNFREGKVYNRIENVLDLERLANPIYTEFGIPRDDQSWQHLVYRTSVGFDPDIYDLDSSLATRMTVVRQYEIDTLYTGDRFTPDVRYRSTHTESLYMIPGRSIVAIIPPDTPSVRGFNIQDTIIVNPGAK